MDAAPPSPTSVNPPSFTNIRVKGKVVLIGSISVGKTSIVSRFVDGTFARNQNASIGVAYSSRTIILDKTTTVKFDIWDTAGQERFRSINALYYRNAAAAVIVYDITDSASFAQIETYWLKQLRQYAMPNIVIALAGNKADVESKREVLQEEVAAFAASEGLLHWETSARTGAGVDELFGAVAGTIRPALADAEGPGTGFSVYEVASATRQSALDEEGAPASGGCQC